MCCLSFSQYQCLFTWKFLIRLEFSSITKNNLHAINLKKHPIEIKSDTLTFSYLQAYYIIKVAKSSGIPVCIVLCRFRPVATLQMICAAIYSTVYAQVYTCI